MHRNQAPGQRWLSQRQRKRAVSKRAARYPTAHRAKRFPASASSANFIALALGDARSIRMTFWPQADFTTRTPRVGISLSAQIFPSSRFFLRYLKPNFSDAEHAEENLSKQAGLARRNVCQRHRRPWHLQARYVRPTGYMPYQ